MSKQNRRPAPRDEARADSGSSPFDDVASLIKERRKYVDWIATLEAKRDQTPAQVFAKVHADYEQRLHAVDEKLATHRGTLSGQQTDLRAKLERIDEEIQHHQDQRAETELRGHVGELSASALTEALRAADTELERLAGARTSIGADLDRVAEFFAAADGTGALPTQSTQRRSPSGFDELSFLQSVVGAAESKPVSEPEKPPTPRTADPVAQPVASAPQAVAPAPAAISTPSVVSPPLPVAPPAVPPVLATVPPVPATVPPVPATIPPPIDPSPPADAFVLQREDDVVAPRPSRVSTPSTRVTVETPLVADTPPPADVVEKAVELTPIAPSRPSIAMHMASMTIEPEDARQGGFIKADEAKKSLLDGISSSAQPEKPFAANVASNNPMSLKSTAPSDTKTLKCRECGSMNDPSEWYCERCGAELSAM